MALIQSLVSWTEAVFMPLGPAGLFVISFIESSFFPIPPDLLLIPLVLADASAWIWLAAITTIGSVLGSLLGYAIGIKGGRPVLHRFAKEERILKTEVYFKKYGDWAIAIAGFTPVPYKLFTIAAGVFRYSISKMLIISVFARGARFFLVAGLLAAWGNEMVVFFDTGFGFATLVIVGVAIAMWYLWRKIAMHKSHQTQA
jgi:undecaprenyl-diphosphatase